jgi:hypothetical protein
MARYDLSEAEWQIVEPLLPAGGKKSRMVSLMGRGCPRAPDPAALGRENSGRPCPEIADWALVKQAIGASQGGEPARCRQ